MNNLMPFQKMATFCGIDTNYQSLKPFGVLGIPADGATTNRSGARLGPAAIRQASLMLTDGVHEKYSHDLINYAVDLGNLALPTGDTNKMLSQLEVYLSALAPSNYHYVALGGDHSITLGLLRNIYKKYGSVGVVHFDAHCDTWSDHFGEKYGHGTWLRNAIDEKLVDPSMSISIGVRSPADLESKNFLSNAGGKTINSRQAMSYSPVQMANIIINKTMSIYGTMKPTYLSLDIDCLDPAYAPGTGTPEIGGLSTIWLSELLDNLYNINWIGMDCVEVAPAYDHSEITSLAAATFCWQYLSLNIDKILK